jgi:hypothetical protein
MLARGNDHRRLGVAMLGTFVALTYLAAAHVTDEQSSFGNRFFVILTPAFVVGLAVVIDSLRGRWRRLVAAGVGALVVWNGVFAFQWAWGLVPKRGPIDWSDTIRQQFTAAPREMGRVAVRFFTDRQGLIDEVQRRDEGQIREGDS